MIFGLYVVKALAAFL